ncbi:5848_t:CDS:2, partial [Ambispora gerdemannii]
FLGEALIVRNNTGGDNTITGANIIPSIAGGHPTPIGTPSPANYANAGAGNSIVAPEITLGQFLYCLEYLYPTVEAQKNLLFFGQITQEGMSILEYNAKISKLGKLAELPESKIREQYIRELNPMNQYNVRIMTKYHDTRDNITKALVEAEKFSLLQGNFPFPPSGGQASVSLEYKSFPSVFSVKSLAMIGGLDIQLDLDLFIFIRLFGCVTSADILLYNNETLFLSKDWDSICRTFIVEF